MYVIARRVNCNQSPGQAPAWSQFSFPTQRLYPMPASAAPDAQALFRQAFADAREEVTGDVERLMTDWRQYFLRPNTPVTVYVPAGRILAEIMLAEVTVPGEPGWDGQPAAPQDPRSRHQLVSPPAYLADGPAPRG